MTKDEIKLSLRQYGMTKDYRASWDSENGRGVILFAVRGKCSIVDGSLFGTQIIIADGLITVWTSKVKKARAFTKAKGIKLRELTGECEFSLPASVGDSFLTDWGARVKPVISEARKAQLATMRQNAPVCKKQPIKEAQTPC